MDYEPVLAELPDPAVQTRWVRAALEEALRLLGENGGCLTAVQGLQGLLEDLAPPPESYPELAGLDRQICEALAEFAALCCLTDEEEIRQVIRTLRRILLRDRCRIDPDPHRHQLDIAIVQRQLWLIGHRSGWLRARARKKELEAQRDAGADPETWQEPLMLLDEYLAAQEGYGRSLRRELENLQAQRMQ